MLADAYGSAHVLSRQQLSGNNIYPQVASMTSTHPSLFSLPMTPCKHESRAQVREVSCMKKSWHKIKFPCMKLEFSCISFMHENYICMHENVKMKRPCIKMKFPCMKMKFPCMEMNS